MPDGRLEFDLPEDDYHRLGRFGTGEPGEPRYGPILSVSQAKRLLVSPAHFYHDATHPPEPRAVFDRGSAAHRLVLGVGADIVEIDADDWRKKAAREQRDEAYATGHIPLLAAEHARVQEMAAALRQHPIAAALLARPGHPEVSAFWTGDDGVERRCRFDYLPNPVVDERFIAWDYKTVYGSAEPAALARTVARFRYHMQDAWYRDGIRHCLDVAEPAFLFVFQEIDPPYCVNVVELDPYAVEIGAKLCARAVEVYSECFLNGSWEAWRDVSQVSLPRWAEMEAERLVDLEEVSSW